MQTISLALAKPLPQQKPLPWRIETIANPNGDLIYRAAMGDRQSTGKTAGAALDALTVQMGSQEINGLLLVQNHQPEQFFIENSNKG